MQIIETVQTWAMIKVAKGGKKLLVKYKGFR